jgi:hypothetical protein
MSVSEDRAAAADRTCEALPISATKSSHGTIEYHACTLNWLRHADDCCQYLQYIHGDDPGVTLYCTQQIQASIVDNPDDAPNNRAKTKSALKQSMSMEMSPHLNPFHFIHEKWNMIEDQDVRSGHRESNAKPRSLTRHQLDYSMTLTLWVVELPCPHVCNS